MRNKILIGVLFMISIIILLMSSYENKITTELSTSALKNTLGKVPVHNKKTGNNNVVSKYLNSVDEIPDEVILELEQQQFSKSLFLEFVVVTKQLSDCSRYSSFNFSNNLPSVKREQLILDYQIYCKKITSDYSSISETNKKRDAQFIVMNLAMNSEFSELIQQGTTFEFFDEEQKIKYFEETIKIYINSHNGFIISMLPDMSKSSDIRIYVNKLSNILGTINQKYTMDIAEQALTLLSCQYSQGLSCNSTSNYMLKQCMDDDKACGLDVKRWFEINHTAAHNRDIAILVDLFSGH